MSQAIRKLKDGDKVSQQQSEKVFKDGNRNISFNLIQKNANQNVQAYLDSKGWGKRKKQAFMDAYSDMISSIDNGSISGRDSSRRYIDSSGRIKNSEGRGFDAYGEAAHFLDTIVDVMPDYEQETPKKEKYNSNGLFDFFKKKTFGGNEIDPIIWQERDQKDETTGKRAVTNRANYFADIIRDYSNSLENSDYDYEGSVYADKSDLLNRLKVAEDNLRNGEFNNDDFSSLTTLGISGEDARNLFSEDSWKEKETPSESEQYLIDAERKKKQEELDRRAEIIRKDEELKEQLRNEYLVPAQNFQRRELQLPSVNYDPIKWGQLLEGAGKEGRNTFYQQLQDMITNNNPFDNQKLNVYNSVLKSNVPYLPHLSNTLYSLRDKVGVDAGNGYYYLPYTINKSNGTVMLYNPSTGTIAQEVIYKVPSLWNKIQNDRRSEYATDLFSFGEGGIIKFQNGGYYSTQNLDFVMDDYKRHKAEQAKKQEAELKETANKKGRTVEQEKAGQKVVDEWSGVEWTRVGSAAADVASIVASFVPGYGTATSAALGVGSTLANLGADIADDSVSAEQAAWNAVQGLGMDVVGLIPGFGAAGKSSKIAKNLIKLTPKLLTLWGARQAYAPAIDALKKLTNDEKLTVDDWKALSAGLSTVAGLSRMGIAAMKAQAYKNAAKTGDKTIKVKSGEMKRITPQQLEELQKKENLTEANKYLKGIKGFENDELEYSFNRGKNPLKAQFYHTPKTGEHYDFNFSRTTKKGDKPFGSSIDERIYRGAVNSEFGGFSIPGIKIPNWMKPSNPYKINKGDKKTSLDEEQINITGFLNSPRYFRLKNKGFTDKELMKRGIYKEGGQIIKAQKGVRNVVGNKDLNWGNNIYGSQGFWKTLDRINKDNLSSYNDMQNTYSTLGFTNVMPGDNLSFNQNVSDYQKLFQQNTDINNLTMSDLVNRGLIKGRGNSSDKGVEWTPDGLAGTQTWLRHLGTKDIDTNQLQEINNKLKSRGIEAFINEDSGMVNFRGLPQEQPTVKPKVKSSPTSTTPSRTSGIQSGSSLNQLEALGYKLPDFISAGRLAGNIQNNNRVTEETLKGLNPLLLDTYELYKPVTGDLATKNAYYNKAAQIESLVSKPRTSDASLQLAGELEGTAKGNELRLQGDLADNEMVRKTSEQNWQANADNIARRTEVSNRNRAAMLGIDKAKHDIEAARKSANWVSLENFLKEREYKQLNKTEQEKNFGLQLAQDNLYRKYFNNPRYTQLYKKATADDATQEQIDEFQSYSDLLSQKYKQDLNREYARIYGFRFGNNYSPIYSAKNGGSIPVAKIRAKTESAKLFQENIKDAVKSHLHMIDNLSSVTKELIIKSMTV